MARITVEDSLEVVPSRFSLVHVASKRARQILKGSSPLIETPNRAVVTSLREIASGKVRVATEADIAREETRKAEKKAAVLEKLVAQAAEVKEVKEEASEEAVTEAAPVEEKE